MPSKPELEIEAREEETCVINEEGRETKGKVASVVLRASPAPPLHPPIAPALLVAARASVVDITPDPDPTSDPPPHVDSTDAAPLLVSAPVTLDAASVALPLDLLASAAHVEAPPAPVPDDAACAELVHLAPTPSIVLMAGPTPPLVTLDP